MEMSWTLLHVYKGPCGRSIDARTSDWISLKCAFDTMTEADGTHYMLEYRLQILYSKPLTNKWQ
jgi:hypothetical protein